MLRYFSKSQPSGDTPDPMEADANPQLDGADQGGAAGEGADAQAAEAAGPNTDKLQPYDDQTMRKKRGNYKWAVYQGVQTVPSGPAKGQVRSCLLCCLGPLAVEPCV